jgi:hypothetical protein
MLVDVETTSGTSLAKIVQENKDTVVVRYLSYKKKGLYDYEDPCEIERECISGFYNPEDTESSAGFKKVDGGYILLDNSDDDYTPSDSESESDSDMSLDEEDGDSEVDG